MNAYIDTFVKKFKNKVKFKIEKILEKLLAIKYNSYKGETLKKYVSIIKSKILKRLNEKYRFTLLKILQKYYYDIILN